MPPGSWHVTARFLGEVKDPVPVEDMVHQIAARHDQMAVEMKGIGAFQSPRRARIVWAKVLADGLRDVVADVVESTKDIGQDPGNQDFVAHATLARLPAARNIEALVDQYADTVFAEGVLDRLVLFQSTLTKGGPIYRRRVEVPFREL